ncbi:MAG: hypothetical protein QG632_415 [Candidatus Dependentiae bacterium]|nr:hypothetical protein [Candidatus Dependentiae bacterium]
MAWDAKMLLFSTLTTATNTCNANSTNTQTPEIFETSRLRAERTTSIHEEYLRVTLNDPKVQETYNTTDVAIFTNLPAQIKIITDELAEHGYGLYTLVGKETGNCIGFAGYHTVSIENGIINWKVAGEDKNIDLHIFLLPKYWHQGYGGEAIITLIEPACVHLPTMSIAIYIVSADKK